MEGLMDLRPGDHFRCTNPMCGCEVVVARKGPPNDNQAFVCGCGSPMKEGWSRPVWIPSLRRGYRLGAS